MQNTTNLYSQSRTNDSSALKNNGSSNKQSSASKGSGSQQSTIFSRNVISKPQANLTAASTTPSTILNNTVEDKLKPVNGNPSNPLGLASNNANSPARSNPFHGTINQSNNGANVLDIFNKKSNDRVHPNAFNTCNTSSNNPFMAAQKSQNSSNIFSNNHLKPTFIQASPNLTTSTNFQPNQSPVNLSQHLNKNNNTGNFPPSNQEATGSFSNYTNSTSLFTANHVSFGPSPFQSDTQQTNQSVATTQTSPNSSNLFDFFHIKLTLCQLQQKIGKYCDFRLNEIDPALKNRQVSKDSQIFDLLSAVIQIKITGDSLKALKEEMDDLEQHSEQLRAELEARLASKKSNGLVEKLKWRKMLEDIEEELTLIERQLYDFIKPLCIAHESSRPVTFEDPDIFSIKVAHSIQKKMAKLQASINELSSQALTSAKVILDLEQANSKEAHAVIAKLTQHFEQICIKFELLKERYIEQRKQSSNQHLRQGQAIQSREKSESLRVENFMRTISKVLEDRNETIERRFSKGSTITSTL